ncbi:MAG: Gfo/Idh/MocA family oxidoreductase [Chloroflexota bacterium]
MSTDKLRVGIIGVGFWAIFSHIPKLRETGRAEVVAIARRNADRLAMAQKEMNIAAAYTDWREMLDKETLDAVIVCTPHNVHREQTIAALEHGLHVLVEKPIALTARDAWAMVAAADRAKRILTVGYDSRGKAIWHAAKQALDAGAVGKIQQVNVADAIDRNMFWDKNQPFNQVFQQMLAAPGSVGTFLTDAISEETWRLAPDAMGGGMFADTGSHMLDLILWLVGSEATEVNALIEKADWPVENYLSLQARLANSAFLSCAESYGVSGGDIPLYGYSHLTISGDKGVLVAETLSDAPEPSIWVETLGVRSKVEPAGEETTPAAAFVASILDGAPNFAPAAEAARVVALTEAVYRSAKEHRSIRVEQSGDFQC